jgi:hypothetical protein
MPNWIAPSILPLFCLMVTYWHDRWPAPGRLAAWTLIGGFAFGLLVVILLHDTRLITKATGVSLPRDFDPLHRVHGWREVAELAGQARRELLKEGKPVILIGGDYGVTSLMAFYLPEAREAMPERPLVYCRTTRTPSNQYFFWPGYRDLKGVNAIYAAPRKLKTSWREFLKDPKGRQLQPRLPPSEAAPRRVQAEFASITSLGVFPAPTRGWPQHWVELYVCRDLR